MTIGWTFTKGNVGEKASDEAVIYSSKSCLTVLRTGKSPTKTISEITGLTEEESKEVLKKYKEEQEEYKKAKQEYDIEYNKILNEWLDADSEYKVKKGNYETRVSFSDALGIPDDEELRKIYSELIVLEMKRESKEILMKELAEDFKKKWGVSSTLVEAVEPKPPIIKQQEEMEKELDELTTKLNKMDLNYSAVSGVVAWFDAMEEYISNMPQYKEDFEPLYEVEQKGVNWIYTGTTAIADPEYNKRIREFKQAQCKKLNAIIEGATSKVEKRLNDIAKKIAPFMPMKNALEIIKGGLSLDTLFKFGKSVFDFCNTLYQMVYQTYKNVIQIMEILVIRFPQLISKLMAKVIELDCPIEARSIKVTMPASPAMNEIKAGGISSKIKNKNKFDTGSSDNFA